jgi:DNA-binding transcriptional MocR family regulator
LQTEKLISERRAARRGSSAFGPPGLPDHSISPITVTQAYYLLESRGLIEARPKSGYFVRARLGQRLHEPAMSHPVGNSTNCRSAISFSRYSIASRPFGRATWLQLSQPLSLSTRQARPFSGQAARKFDPLATVTDLPPGNEELRRQIVLRYLARGAVVSPQEMVITSGAMEGLNLCLQAVTRPVT